MTIDNKTNIEEMNLIVNNFIENLKKEQDPVGVLIFGSWARGNNRPDSDVDLLVIVEKGFNRTVEYFENVAFEITYNTEIGTINFWKKHPDDCADFWKTAKILYSRDNTLNQLKQEGLDIIKNGKPALDEIKRQHLVFDAYDQLKAAESLLKTDYFTTKLLLNRKLLNLLEIYFDIRQLWTPAPKQLISTLDQIDPTFSNLIRDFYSTEDVQKKIELTQNIITYVFKDKS